MKEKTLKITFLIFQGKKLRSVLAQWSINTYRCCECNSQAKLNDIMMTRNFNWIQVTKIVDFLLRYIYFMIHDSFSAVLIKSRNSLTISWHQIYCFSTGHCFDYRLATPIINSAALFEFLVPLASTFGLSPAIHLVHLRRHGRIRQPDPASSYWKSLCA